MIKQFHLPIDRTLTCTITPGQSRCGSNGKKWHSTFLKAPGSKNLSIKCRLVVGGDLTAFHKCSWCFSTAPADWAGYEQTDIHIYIYIYIYHPVDINLSLSLSLSLSFYLPLSLSLFPSLTLSLIFSFSLSLSLFLSFSLSLSLSLFLCLSFSLSLSLFNSLFSLSLSFSASLSLSLSLSLSIYIYIYIYIYTDWNRLLDLMIYMVLMSRLSDREANHLEWIYRTLRRVEFDTRSFDGERAQKILAPQGIPLLKRLKRQAINSY